MGSPVKLVERYKEIMVELHQLLTETRNVLDKSESQQAFAIMNEVQKRIDGFSQLPELRLEVLSPKSSLPRRRESLDEYIRIESLVRILSVKVNVRLANVLFALRADFLSKEESPRSESPVLRGTSITGVVTVRVQYVQAIPCL